MTGSADRSQHPPAEALARLADELRAEEVIAPHVQDPRLRPTLGELVATGPRAEDAPGEYGLLFEAIREGFLTHYGEPRLLAGSDHDLRLLTGDYLYALGLERLAARGDTDAVHELADLISLSAQVLARGGDGRDDLIDLLWLASAVAVGAGPEPAHAEAKAAVRSQDADAERLLGAATALMAERGGMGPALASAADSIGFARTHLFERG